MTRTLIALLTLALVWSTGGSALAHITPPGVLVSDREAVAGLLAGARRFFVREVKLTAPQRQALQRAGWTADEDFYRFYIGRDEQARLVGVMVFLTEYTVHGPLRVAVGLGPDGKVRGASVVELTEETYPWLKPLIDRDFTKQYVGLDSRGTFGLRDVGGDSMSHFYGHIVASLVQRAALLYDVVLGPETKS
jgi:hypothetical protein